jgi:hypothetical protein
MQFLVAVLQDLQEYRKHREQESLRQVVLPPEAAALHSAAAALELKKAG